MSLAQTQIVLHLRHEQLRHAGHAAPYHAPVEALVLCQRQIFGGVGDVLRRGLLPPQQQGTVVVGAGVADAVGRVGVGEVAAGVAGVEGEFQHLHARPAGVVQQLRHLRRGIAQILRDELQLGEPAVEPVDQIHAGTCDPVTVFGGGLAVGHRPVAGKAAEMVDADHVIELACAVDAAYPPAEAVLPHGVPVIQGVAPQLAVGGEVVRRDAGHRLGHQLLVQLEELRLRPHVGGIQRHIDGQVADDADALLVDIVPQKLPLGEEQELQVGEELHIVGQQRSVFLQNGLAFAQADVLVLPLRPCLHAEVPLAGHVQGVVRQPAPVLLHKGGHLVRVPLPAPLVGLVQQGEAAFVDLAVVHVAGVAAPVAFGAFGSFQQPILDKHIRVDEIGVAGVGGKALIGGVAVAGGVQGQHLPVGLTGCLQKIDEVIGRLAQGADAVGGGQGGDCH